MRKMALNGTWKMTGGGYACEGTIPGSVYSFLLEKELIPDPYWRANELQILPIMENDFEFCRTFTFDAADVPVYLVCEGLDTLCDIYLNGKHVAHTENMHRRFVFDVTDMLISGENELRFVFASPNRYVREMYKAYPIPGNDDTLKGHGHLRKAGYMMGWDWGPRLPDAGIWKDIYLLAEDSDRIEELHVTQRHADGRVFITPALRCHRGTATVAITVTDPAGRRFEIPAGVETEIAKPDLWWPRGLGGQPLYTVTAELYEDGQRVDEKSVRIGLRTLELIREKDEYGESFCHACNGVRFFAMGADYIPEDCILTRITEERTRKLLKTCADSNFNAIRVWGGGFYPHDFFFDACDELGIVVFFDLMFACQCIPSREDFLENVSAEIRDNLRRLRHHASIGILSGNNEMEDAVEYWWGGEEKNERKRTYLRLFEQIIPRIHAEECPYIPYVPSSPSSGGSFVDIRNENIGDYHYWNIWHGNEPFTGYRNHYFRYLSEFGFESFPCEKTVEAFTLPEDRNIFNRIFEMHQRCKGANGKILNYLSRTFLYPTEFGTLLYASQLLQAEAMRYAVEHLRRHRGRCMGALYWQLNDVWPVASWSGIDYFGRRKALQYVAKRFYAPVMISCEEIGETTTRPFVVLQPDFYDYSTEARLSVTNETMEAVCGTVRWELRRSDAVCIESGEEEITIPALSSVWLENMDFHKTDVEHNYLSFAFVKDGETVSEGTVLFTVPKHFAFEDPHLRYECSGDEITVYADAFAKYVEIDSPDSDFVLSDNYFDMNAGKKTVRILEGEPGSIRLRSVWDIR